MKQYIKDILTQKTNSRLSKFLVTYVDFKFQCIMYICPYQKLIPFIVMRNRLKLIYSEIIIAYQDNNLN